jgi:hypothetical protein
MNKPRIWKRKGEWFCIVRGNSHSRMGSGKSPEDAYRSWEFWNSSFGEFIARQKWPLTYTSP